MQFDFDQPIDRRGTHSQKWDLMESRFGVPAATGLPLWVADMDFRPPPSVNAALAEAVAHGVHGYIGEDAGYRQAICGWMERRHGWTVDPGTIATVHGVASGICIALQAFTSPGDRVVMFTPIYDGFFRIVKANGCEVLECPLARDGDRFRMDLAALAPLLNGREKVLLLCSPHNPVGQIWTAEELKAVADFAAEHDLLIFSDEIHADLAMPGVQHTVLPLAAPEHAGRTVMFTATTKTFNIAGAVIGNVTITDPVLRARFRQAAIAANPEPNRLSVLMATAAYQGGDDWLDALRPYLAGNRQLLADGLAAIPGCRPLPLDATYLQWVDLRSTGIDDAGIAARLARSGVAVSPGIQFGLGGSGHIRVNFATQRHLLQQAIGRIQSAFSDLQ